MRHEPGSNQPGSAVWFNRPHLRRCSSQPGMSCREARPRLQAPRAGWCPGRGPAAGRRDDCDHPHRGWRPLLLQARQGPVCAGRRNGAGRPALSTHLRLGHITGARSCRHRLRQRHSLTQNRQHRLRWCGQDARGCKLTASANDADSNLIGLIQEPGASPPGRRRGAAGPQPSWTSKTRVPQLRAPVVVWLDLGGMYSVASHAESDVSSGTAKE